MITDHHDGFGLAESMHINRLDEPGPGGAHHRYEVDVEPQEGSILREMASVTFQRGPRDEKGSQPGIIDSVLIAIVLDRLRSFQAGDYSCRENALAITKLEEAIHWMQHRARSRAARGVLGTMEK